MEEKKCKTKPRIIVWCDLEAPTDYQHHWSISQWKKSLWSPRPRTVCSPVASQSQRTIWSEEAQRHVQNLKCQFIIGAKAANDVHLTASWHYSQRLLEGQPKLEEKKSSKNALTADFTVNVKSPEKTAVASVFGWQSVYNQRADTSWGPIIPPEESWFCWWSFSFFFFKCIYFSP